jgi:hypothetical protein
LLAIRRAIFPARGGRFPNQETADANRSSSLTRSVYTRHQRRALLIGDAIPNTRRREPGHFQGLSRETRPHGDGAGVARGARRGSLSPRTFERFWMRILACPPAANKRVA